MSKNILLVRHAKSSWAYPELDDKERPLNKRGKNDGPFMANFCRELGLVPDRLLSSPAVRAYRTAQFFHSEFNEEVASLTKESDLYFGSESDWMYLMNELPEAVSFPAFFSHNPTITYFANMFADEILDNVPTCGVIHLKSTAELWSEVGYGNTRMENYYFPKLVRDL